MTTTTTARSSKSRTSSRIPGAILDRLMEAIGAGAALIPEAQAGHFAHLLAAAANELDPDLRLEGVQFDLNTTELDLRIRRALARTVDQIADLWPQYRQHVAAALLACAVEIGTDGPIGRRLRFGVAVK